MAVVIEVLDVQVMPLCVSEDNAVYAVRATVRERGRERAVVFVTDTASGRVKITGQLWGDREVMWPERYGPRLGRAWVHEFYARIGRRMS